MITDPATVDEGLLVSSSGFRFVERSRFPEVPGDIDHLPWRTLFSVAFRRSEHITVLEGRAAL